MKYLFLDVDGVLNNWNECSYGIEVESQLVPRCINLLKDIVDKTNCEIVLSSSWRLFGTEHKNQFFRILDQEYRIKINYETPRLIEGDRADEILKFLENSIYDNFAILDDEDFEFRNREELKDHFVKTSGMFKRGLTRENADQVISILGGTINES